MPKFILLLLCVGVFAQSCLAGGWHVADHADDDLKPIFVSLLKAVDMKNSAPKDFAVETLSDGRIRLAGHFEKSETFGTFPVQIDLRLDPDAIVVEVTGMPSHKKPASPYANTSRFARVDAAGYVQHFTPGTIRPRRVLIDLVKAIAAAVVVDHATDCIGSLVRAELW